jgi:hypothetical protein
LLGVPADLELVQIDKKVPPFYEGVFRTEDYQATDELLKDPLARERDIARLPFAGEISEVRPDRFGPGVLAGKSQ